MVGLGFTLSGIDDLVSGLRIVLLSTTQLRRAQITAREP